MATTSKLDRYSRLQVLEDLGDSAKCLCDCGTLTTVKWNNLESSNTRSCGCLHFDTMSELKRTHGDSGTLLYTKWYDIHRNTTWKHYEEFRDWVEDTRKDDTQVLSRVDTDLPFGPGNCVWSSKKYHATISRSLAWVLTTPEGEEISVVNLTGYCRDNGLSQPGLWAVANGDKASHLGWKCRRD